MAVLYKTHTVYEGAYVIEDPIIKDSISSVITFDPVPVWFVVGTGSKSYSFTAPNPGQYTINFTDDTTQKAIIIDVLASTTLYTTCCDNQCNIVWFNRQGGTQNYIFTGYKTFEVQGGEAKTYITSSLIKRNSEISKVYNGRICTTGPITPSHVDLLDSLRYSIQAWLLVGDPTDPASYREIFIDRENWIKYTTKDKLLDLSIRFIFSQEIAIQTQ